MCDRIKPIEDFLRDKQQKKGYRNQCKACLRPISRQRARDNKDGVNRRMRVFRNTIKGATTTSLNAAKGRARLGNLPFNLDLKYIRDIWERQGGKCALTGEDFVLKGGWSAPSLDKIDPEKGYIKGNVQWLSQRVNLLKSNMTNEELLEICKLIVNTLERNNT